MARAVKGLNCQFSKSSVRRTNGAEDLFASVQFIFGVAFSGSRHLSILGFLLLIQILGVLLTLFQASRGRWCDSGRLEAPTQALQSHPRPANAPAVEHKDNLPILSMLYQLCYDSASFPLLRCNMLLFEKHIPSPIPAPPPLPILSWIKYSLCLYYHSSLLPFFFVSFR